MASMIVVRHGITDDGKDGAKSLSPKGITQMEKLAKRLLPHFEDVPHHEFAVVSSLCQWACESAEILASVLGCGFSVLDGLDTTRWFGTGEENSKRTKLLLESIENSQTAKVIVVVTHKEMAESVPGAIDSSDFWSYNVEEGKGWLIEGQRIYRIPLS